MPIANCQRVNPFFCSKNGQFSNFFFLGNIGQTNVFYDILKRKNAFLGYKNKKFKKSKKLTFFQRVYPMVLVQKWPFFQLLLLGNICQENVFYDILERKYAFLACKNKNFKKSKNGHFFKGFIPWFWSNNGHFSNFSLLGNIGQENFFYDILEQKQRLSRL